ncbi:MAG: trypsin-like serine protease [Actinomycetota bacterium]|nr:trypsin-like serine protease [Actinomycetota bacterium]
MHIRRVLALTLGLALISSSAQALPTIMQGTTVVGDGHTAQLIIMGTDSRSYDSCSAAVWKPRVLITAAHCVTDSGSSQTVALNRVFALPPGSPGPLVSTNGPEGGSRIHVTSIAIGQAFAHTSSFVVGNDIAVLVLDSDLAPSAFTRLADRTEIQKLADAKTQTTIVGYGRTSSTDQARPLPRSGAFTLSETEAGRRATDGLVIWSLPVDSSDTCPGDSGAPQFFTASDRVLLLGEVAGGNCSGQARTAQGFAAITYLGLLNPALAAAGYPAIPSAPTSVLATTMNGRDTIWWSAPATAPEAVTGYEVRDPAGAILCNSTQPYCSFPHTENTTLRSINAQGEGDAVVVPAAADIRPATPSMVRTSSRIRFTVQPLSYPVVTGYRIIDQRGKVACRIVDPVVSLSCSASGPSGKYQFTVSATTPQGRTPESAPTRVIRVS